MTGYAEAGRRRSPVTSISVKNTPAISHCFQVISQTRGLDNKLETLSTMFPAVIDRNHCFARRKNANIKRSTASQMLMLLEYCIISNVIFCTPGDFYYTVHRKVLG